MTQQPTTPTTPTSPTAPTSPAAGPTLTAATGPRRLTRSRDDRWLGGVCGGVAEYTGLDANLVRLVVVLGTLVGLGSLLVAYLAAWVLMPRT